MLLGNFNEILLLHEVKGGEFSFCKAAKFVEVLDTCSLMDMGSIGYLFTWSRIVQGRRQISKRLDRVLVDVDWGKVSLGLLLRHFIECILIIILLCLGVRC